MGEVSGIQWTDSTFNAWIGCRRLSPACDHCYAEVGSRRLAAQHNLKLWDGEHFMTGTAYWRKPHVWNKKALASGQPWRVFCGSFCDVFEDHPDVTDARIGLGEVIRETPALTWMLLTKRPENASRLGQQMGFSDQLWPRNVWLGTTVESSDYLHRIDSVRAAPAQTRFVSMEPLLEDIVSVGRSDLTTRLASVDWLIIGGESGRHARRFQVKWAYDLVELCRRTNTAPFVKQLGSVWAKENGAKDTHGGDPMEWPEPWPWPREFPEAA